MTDYIVQQSNFSNAADSFTSSILLPSMTVTAGNTLVCIVYAYGQSITSSLTFSDVAGNTYKFGYLQGCGWNTAVTWSTAPSSGATSVSLNAGWAGSSGNYVFQFSDNDLRYVTGVTNGSAGPYSWTGGLTQNCTTAGVLIQNNPIIVGYFVQNAIGGTTTLTVSSGNSGLGSVYLAEIKNVVTSGGLLGAIGNFITNPGTTPNAVTSGSLTLSQQAVLFGFSYAGGGTILSAAALAAGTGFTGETPVWIAQDGGDTYGVALAEDALVSTSTAATFTAGGGGQFGNYSAMAMAFGYSSGAAGGPYVVNASKFRIKLGGQIP